MNYLRFIYYNLLALKNNIFINFLLFCNILYPSYFNDKIIHYKNIGDNYYKYIILLNFGNKIEKKYNIDIINIGLKLYDKYNNTINNKNNNNNNDIDDNDDFDTLSISSDMSNISDISNLENEL
jgi:hypothetical protein